MTRVMALGGGVVELGKELDPSLRWDDGGFGLVVKRVMALGDELRT